MSRLKSVSENLENQINTNISKYQTEHSGLFSYVSEIVEEKASSDSWDKGTNADTQNLTLMLLIEYAISIEQITHGKISANFVIDKLKNEMGTFRFGDFKKGIDDNITYDNNSVTSPIYTQQCRIKTGFGAHAIPYTEQDQIKSAVVLFDNKQEYEDTNGNKTLLSGIHLNNLSDIRGTVFHEWTHILEQVLIKTSELNKDDIIFENNGSTYINTAGIGPNLSTQEYLDFISNPNQSSEVIFAGISTIEINENKSSRRIMHNQISEGATEYIARLVLEQVGDTPIDSTRYARQVDIIKQIFESKGIANAVSMYLKSPHKLIKELESHKVGDKDILHYISEHISLLDGINGNLRYEIKDKLTHKLPPEELNDKLSEISMQIRQKTAMFWKENNEPAPEQQDKLFNELLDLIGINLSINSRELLKTLINYPQINRTFQTEINNAFPKRSRNISELRNKQNPKCDPDD